MSSFNTIRLPDEGGREALKATSPHALPSFVPLLSSPLSARGEGKGARSLREPDEVNGTVSNLRQRILLIAFVRERELGLLAEAVSALRSRFPEAEIIGLAPASFRALLSSVSVDSWVWQEEPRVLGLLRQMRLDAACIVYSNASRVGHLKLEVLAMLCGARRMFRWRQGSLSAIGRGSLGAQVAAKCGLLVPLLKFGAMTAFVAGALLLPRSKRPL